MTENLQERERFAFTMRDLIHGALTRRFVGAPAKNFCAVSKSSTGKMVVGDLDNDFWIERFPFPSALRAPATWAARRIAGESRCFTQPLEFFCQRTPFACFESGSESDVMK